MGLEPRDRRVHTSAGRLMTRAILALVLLAAIAATAIRPALVRTTLGGTNASLSNRRDPTREVAPPTTAKRHVSPKAPARGVAASTTTTSRPPLVPSMGDLHEADAVITMPASATPAQLLGIEALPDVELVEVVDTGTVQLAGAPAATIGVEPGTFRDFTPKVTASSDQLWQYIASGTLASSFEMARDRKLTLGAKLPVVAVGGAAVAAPAWLGAFMSVGLPGVDLVVSRNLSGPLHLLRGSGLIVTAPQADPFAFQAAVKQLVPGAAVVLMRPGIALGSPGGSFLNATQRSTMLAAALSRVGKPYLWGAIGPNGFDCSGLVGWSYAAAGISLPRTAAEQALTGPRVPLNQIQPGDLLFWAYDDGDPGFIDHVAIYLGHGDVVVAPETGQLVQVRKVNASHLVGAVRVNPAISSRMGGPWVR